MQVIHPVRGTHQFGATRHRHVSDVLREAHVGEFEWSWPTKALLEIVAIGVLPAVAGIGIILLAQPSYWSLGAAVFMLGPGTWLVAWIWHSTMRPTEDILGFLDDVGPGARKLQAKAAKK